MSGILYLDTSAVLRAILEWGITPEIERRIAEAEVLITSRLSLVEASRALVRLRVTGQCPERALADAARELDALWSRCEIWELTPAVCELAQTVVPHQQLRTLDALHLATWLQARRRLGEVSLVTADQRLQVAADGS